MSKASAARAMMSPVLSEWRAFFAPVDRATGTPTVFDPARMATFDVNSPPAPWIDGGNIVHLTRVAGTKVQQARGGQAAAVANQFRAGMDARVEFDFLTWGKLQMAIAGGGEHFNVLAATGGSAPSGGTAISAVPVQSGSTASNVVVGAANVPAFSVGDLVAVDVDYTGQIGYVGSGVGAAYVRSASGLGVDYVRRVTFNVERIASKTTDTLVLARALMGGAPSASAKVQKVIGFVDREGSRFFQEWSAVFVSGTQSGGRVCFYYPRLQASAAAGENSVEIADPLRAVTLHANLIALPYVDPVDGQLGLCWRSYVPGGSAAAY